jgi:hypothetical protein
MTRPRLFLVCEFTELQWAIKAQLAVAALPEAEVAVFDEPPAASAEFAALLRTFCERHW